MEFFNKKEEVIDLQLTQYGRHLFSKGKFKPAYYSFYDDNILYDIAKVGRTETQNEAEERIKTAPTLHPQTGYSSLEKEFQNNYDLILAGKAAAGDASIQRTPEKHYLLPQPIGTSDINSEYAPSWSVLFLNRSMSGSASPRLELKEESGDKNILNIPQINSHMKIEVTDISDGAFEYDEALDGPLQSNFGILTNEENTYIVLKVIENNGFYQKKNFDIELYEISEEEKPNAKATATLMSTALSVSAGLTLIIKSRYSCPGQSPDGCTTTHTFTTSTDATSYNNIDIDNCDTPENFIAELKTAIDLAIASDGMAYITTSAITNDSADRARVLTLTQNFAGPDGNYEISGTLIGGQRLLVNNIISVGVGGYVHGTLAFTGGDSIIVETLLRPLKFSKSYVAEDELTFMGSPIPKNDQNHVEYYFDFRVDDEINTQTLCRLDPINEKIGVFADERTVLCQDVLNERKKAIGNIYIKEGAPPNPTAPGAGEGPKTPGDSNTPGEVC